MNIWGGSRYRELPGRLWVEPNLARALLKYFDEAAPHERGGVLLGRRGEEDSSISLAVFPPQLATETSRCSFNTSSLEVIHAALAKIAQPEIKQKVSAVIGWIHSHPGHGIFLSQTDRTTLGSWLALDERAIAVVVDPSIRGYLEDRIGWWDKVPKMRRVTIENSEADFIGIVQTSVLAEAISETAVRDSGWDVVAPGCIIKFLTTPSAMNGRDE
jgi:proteasome lid subunit RPN8/RPN11